MRPGARKRGYDTRWEKARATHLRHEPLCRMCRARGVTTTASVVDHIVPHKGDQERFWDKGNWQSLCGTCHDGAKQSLERTGVERGCDESGIPLDPGHHWRER